MVIDSSNSEIRNLQKFKELSSDRKNHKHLLSDKKAILYAATLLDHDSTKVIELCLDIFENFLVDKENHVSLISTFGIYESLESLSIRMRDIDEDILKRASEITETLRNSAPPAFGTRSRAKGGKCLKKQTVYLLYIQDLAPESRQKIEEALVKIRGVVSFLIDIRIKRCTLRICPKVTIKEVVEKISAKCGMKCLVIRKNKSNGVESYIDILTTTPNRSYLEYPEEDFLQKSGAIASTQADRSSGSGFLNSVRNFWNQSFYW